jgi:hypothetical protein
MHILNHSEAIWCNAPLSRAPCNLTLMGRCIFSTVGIADPCVFDEPLVHDRLEEKARAITKAKAVREAKRVVGIWNARHTGDRSYGSIRRSVLQSPQVLYCPACQQIGEADLRKLDRQPNEELKTAMQKAAVIGAPTITNKSASIMRQPGSIPCALRTGKAAGPLRNSTRLFAASVAAESDE